MKVLHLVHSAPPDVTGASVRTRYVVEAQRRLGLRPAVLSSPYQRPIEPDNAHGCEQIESIPYYRCFAGDDGHAFMEASKPLRKRAARLLGVPAFIRRARRLAAAERVDVVHGHGLFYCGVAAAMVGRSLGIPSLYEVRSLIEEGLVAQGGTRRGGLLHRAYRASDALAVRLTTHVTAISEGLRRDLVARGCRPDRITVIGNGVDGERQKPAGRRSTELMARLGFSADAFVVGYIGTLFTYESLDLLIEVAGKLGKDHPQLAVLFVGDGDAAGALEEAARSRCPDRRIRFAGKVPHEVVGEYYSLVDLFVLPRGRSRLTDLVTPLKPLEIMARGKALLASDCGGHLELVRDGVNGYTFRAGDPAHLAERLRDCIARRHELPTLGLRAREWVLANRSWDTMVRPCVDLYERLTRPRRRRPLAGSPRARASAQPERPPVFIQPWQRSESTSSSVPGRTS